VHFFVMAEPWLNPASQTPFGNPVLETPFHAEEEKVSGPVLTPFLFQKRFSWGRSQVYESRFAGYFILLGWMTVNQRLLHAHSPGACL
jgi:hypothetical protein